MKTALEQHDDWDAWCEDCGAFLGPFETYEYPHEDARGVTTACVLCFAINYALTDKQIDAMINSYYEEIEDDNN